ncbi:phage tail domain-containing protein [Latilactobacillus sakei]|uniref:Phage tail family protein n=1 Tax=Latilactobacillus sakei TaxID=1599 RepID=A0AAF0GS24_LATSK|nr:phage tail domain-containing protein [Latilactobacillus sakei]WGI18551.1 phage tail family protein [Latilactobacillus sakei]
MDLLIEKLDSSRVLLSQYEVLVTEFEEGAPVIERNATQLEQRNGSIDFGGWHKSKTINVSGYYRAESQDDEEALREKLFAVLCDPNGYYIMQLKTDVYADYERPGQHVGNYFDRINNSASHKRFLVYTEEPEIEFVGAINGTLLYKLSVEFTTMKLPYGETVPANIAIANDYIPYIGTVPCNQLEQQFIVRFTAKATANSLKITLNNVELTYSGSVKVGDVFQFSGFSYVQNGINIVAKTNKQYFELLPNISNTVSTSVNGSIELLNFQNLFA